MRSRPIGMFVTLVLIGCALFGCAAEKQQVVVASRTLKKQATTSTAVPDEFSSFAPASTGSSFWVEGTVRNEGASDVSNVEILFKCTEGFDARVLVASVKEIPAGKAVGFKTKPYSSKTDLKLTDEEAEITFEE